MHFRLSCRSDMQHWQLSCRCIRKNVSCPIVLYVFSTFSMYWKYASKSATLWNHAQTFTNLFQNFSYFELSSLGFSITVFVFEMFCIRCLCDGSKWHSWWSLLTNHGLFVKKNTTLEWLIKTRILIRKTKIIWTIRVNQIIEKRF